MNTYLIQTIAIDPKTAEKTVLDLRTGTIEVVQRCLERFVVDGAVRQYFIVKKYMDGEYDDRAHIHMGWSPDLDADDVAEKIADLDDTVTIHCVTPSQLRAAQRVVAESDDPTVRGAKILSNCNWSGIRGEHPSITQDLTIRIFLQS